jgi:hypothetical protein
VLGLAQHAIEPGEDTSSEYAPIEGLHKRIALYPLTFKAAICCRACNSCPPIFTEDSVKKIFFINLYCLSIFN